MRESRKPIDSEPKPMPSDKPQSVPLQPVVRCNQFQHGICDNPELYGGRGSTSPCPHSIPHSPFRGCDKEEAGCPIFAPIVPPCKCVAIDTSNPTKHRATVLNNDNDRIEP